MSSQKTLFDLILDYPDPIAQRRLNGLIGLDSYRDSLTKGISIAVNPHGFKDWLMKFHPKANILSGRILARPRMFILAGDVGSGKTTLAESIGDNVARHENHDKIPIRLFKLSLAVRGSGHVGEVSLLITEAFSEVADEAKKARGASGANRAGFILLIDEADSLAQSRENEQMHHEDRAGVNAVIRGIDRLSAEDLPAVVLMCTNRLSAIDPAVRRRAADILVFSRPDEAQRIALLSRLLEGCSITSQEIGILAKATGSVDGRDYGFTHSDIVDRLIPLLVMESYPDGPIKGNKALEIARQMLPTPPFKDGN